MNICCVGKALGSTILSGYLFGEIGLERYSKLVSDDMDGMSSADTAFKLFDKDRDGFITRAEFAKVIFYDGYGFDGGRYGWDAVDDS